MSSDHCRLLDLTPEILVLIAGYCDAWSLLRFGKTCRTIRSLCDDVVISQAAVEHCLDGWRGCDPLVRSEFSVSSNCHVIPHRVLKKWLPNDKRFWTRMLIAIDTAEKTPMLLALDGHLENGRPEDLSEDVVVFGECEYLPQLIVSTCMSDLRLNCFLLTDYLLSRPEDMKYLYVADWTQLPYDDHSRIGFCFASQTLIDSKQHWQLSDRSDMNEWHRHNIEHTKIVDRLAANAALIREGLMDRFGNYLQISPMRPVRQQALCFKAVGVIASFARRDTRSIALPLLDRLPLVDLGVKPPVPYWDDTLDDEISWLGWLCRHNAAASQESRLKGEWVGLFLEGMMTHPITENIHFRHEPFPDEVLVDGPVYDHRGTLPISADDCFDPVGHFSLRGQLTAKGNFYAEKRYTRHNQLHWNLSGAMTPFGIVGKWWQYETSEDGYFWLYKRAWCTPSTDTFKDLPTSNIIIDPYPEDTLSSDDDLDDLDDLESDDLDSFDEDEESSDSGGSESEQSITGASNNGEPEDGDNNTQEAQ